MTDTWIRIGYGDDRGYPGLPGLDADVGDAMKAMIRWCNDQGGIQGRRIVGDYYDAALTQVDPVVEQACKSDFMLVGEGWALDEAAEGTRVACNLVSVPAFTIGADFASGPMMYQAVPNPVDYLPASVYFEVARLFPQAVQKADVIHTTLTAATEVNYNKDLEAMAAAGWTNADCGVTINYQGEPDYKPFAQRFATCGVRLIYSNLSPGAQTEDMFSAIHLLGLRPQYVFESNVYTSELAQWNKNHILDHSVFRMAFQPLENVRVPAVKSYLSIVRASGGTVGLLGEQTASSFLLWASAAKSCASTLTRQCMVDALSRIHHWTGGGLHAPTDPGANLPPKCGMLIQLVGSTYSQIYPRTTGQFECNDQYLFHVSPSHWGTSIGADRISTRFLGPKLIHPQL